MTQIEVDYEILPPLRDARGRRRPRLLLGIGDRAARQRHGAAQRRPVDVQDHPGQRVRRLPVRLLPRDAAASRWSRTASWGSTRRTGRSPTATTRSPPTGRAAGAAAARRAGTRRSGSRSCSTSFDPEAARDFDADLGVNHTSLVFQVTHADISGLGHGEPAARRRHQLVARAHVPVLSRRLRIVVEYDGTDFSGWQRQVGAADGAGDAGGRHPRDDRRDGVRARAPGAPTPACTPTGRWRASTSRRTSRPTACCAG